MSSLTNGVYSAPNYAPGPQLNTTWSPYKELKYSEGEGRVINTIML